MAIKWLFLVCSIILTLSLAVYSLSEKQSPSSFLGGYEINSPSDWIKENQIQVHPTKVIISLKNASWASFTDTNSMDPFLDSESNAIEVKPSSPQQIKLGDIIAYQTFSGTIIHRVIETGVDEQGYYFIVKGDNNALHDSEKVRFEDIKGVVVAIIY